MIREFLQNTEKNRQTQAELLEIEKNDEMQLLSRSYSEQSLHRTKDTLSEYNELFDKYEFEIHCVLMILI